MIRQIFHARRRQILIDVNTQKDFFLHEGIMCIRNHRRVLANIRRIMAWVRSNDIPVISTCEVYPNNPGSSTSGYCVDSTSGQKKLRYTLLDNRISFPADGSTDLPRDVLRQYRQIILHKRITDPFEEPRIERLLTEVHAREFIIIGACAEEAVKAMVLGLLQQGKRLSVVVDAVGSRDIKEAQMAIRKMKAKGARLIETKKLAGSSHLQLVGICKCKICQGKPEKVPAQIGGEY